MLKSLWLLLRGLLRVTLDVLSEQVGDVAAKAIVGGMAIAAAGLGVAVSLRACSPSPPPITPILCLLEEPVRQIGSAGPLVGGANGTRAVNPDPGHPRRACIVRICVSNPAVYEHYVFDDAKFDQTFKSDLPDGDQPYCHSFRSAAPGWVDHFKCRPADGKDCADEEFSVWGWYPEPRLPTIWNLPLW